MGEKKNVITNLVELGKRNQKITTKEINDALEAVSYTHLKTGNFYQHVNGRLNVVVFPVGNALLCNAKRLGQLYLAEVSGGAKLAYLATQHSYLPQSENITILLYDKN